MTERKKKNLSDTEERVPKSRASAFIITISVVLTLFTIGMFFFFQQSGWTGARIAGEAFFALLTTGMIAGCVSHRMLMVISRIGAAFVFLIYFYYIIHEFLFSGQAMRISSFSEPSPYASLLGFLFWGIPCLLYALWGSQWGRVGVVPPEQWSNRDIVVARISIFARRLFLILLLLAVLRQLAMYFYR